MRETWFPETAEGDTAFERVIDHRPAYAAALREVEAALWEQDVLDVEILELCRRRTAQLLRAPVDLIGSSPAAADLDPALVEALPQWPTSPRFTERQRMCLAHAEQLLIDAQGVTDAQAADLIAEVGEGGFLVLTYGCGFFETTQRARLLLSGSAHEQ